MTDNRIEAHPILPVPPLNPVEFTWQGRSLTARRGEMIASALFAHGIHVFGHHHRDGSPQGIFCANGQCSQCLVIADGLPVKACMTPVTPGMAVESLEGLPVLPPVAEPPPLRVLETVDVRNSSLAVGQAGIGGAQLARVGVHVLLVDDKARLGGKLIPADPSLLRLGGRGLRGHARHRHRYPARRRGAPSSQHRRLAQQHGPRRF